MTTQGPQSTVPAAFNQYSIRHSGGLSPQEIQLTASLEETGWPQFHPGSTLVACIGNHWKPGAWEHVANMMKYSIDQGLKIELMEIQDRCFNYADALGTMRNEAVQLAQLRGFEFVLLVENDTWPPHDALVRLINAHNQHRANILVPFICEQGSGRPLHGPSVGPDAGFKWVKWSVLSFILFKTCVFSRYPGGFWSDTMGADEGFHFERLYRDGYYLGMDTNVQVPTLRRPQYPLSTNHMQEAERKAHWDWVNQDRLRSPDRRPIDPSNPMIDGNGCYNPFIEPAKPEEENHGSDTGTAPGRDTDLV